MLYIFVIFLISAAQAEKLSNFGKERIIGGIEAEPHQFPWQVAIIAHDDFKESLCGGTLLNKNYVLTAAACLTGINYVEMLLGTNDLQRVEETEVRRESSDFKIHEKFNMTNSEYNIALIKIEKDVPIIEGRIELITLASEEESGKSIIGKPGTVSGWGWTSEENPEYSTLLRYMISDIISNEDCIYYYPGIKDSVMCASASADKSPCAGDGGDPLTITVDGIAKQVGLLSYGNYFGCTSGFPVVYTKVASYLEWISTNSL